MKLYLVLTAAFSLSACAINHAPSTSSAINVIVKTEAAVVIQAPPYDSLPSSFDTFADNIGFHFEPFYQDENVVYYFDTKTYTLFVKAGNFGYTATILVDVRARDHRNETPEQVKVAAMTALQHVQCNASIITLQNQKSWTNKQLERAELLENNNQTEQIALTSTNPAWILCNKAAQLIGH